MYKIYKSLLLIILCFSIVLLSSSSFAESKNKGSNGKKLSKTTGVPNHTKLNINNISTFIYNHGDSDLDLLGNSGFQYPKGSGKTAIFESGFIWGAKVNGVLQVGGSTYNHGLQPGKILSPGVAEDPNLAKNRIYRVRPDYKTANLASAASDEGLSETEIYNQYQTDWNEWPAADGAPFDDKDSNGVYNPDIDIPGVPGASQTVWFVANDLDQNLTTKLYGSNPMGIEMQATMWAYSQAGPLSNMFFRRYVIINKSETAFTDMIVTMWSDPDNGDASDDFAGCDTALSLGFCYNSKNNDAVYGELPPPATGFDFFQGPIVPGTANDSAIFKGRVIHGKKNLPMTAFFYFDRTIPALEDPVLGSYEGTIQMYNFMQGRIGKTGQFFVTPPPESKPTTFANTGDPVAGTGWLDGTQSPAGDRRLGLSSGTFTMAAGDTQEVVVAEIAAEGTDRLQSVKLLKSYDEKAQQAYNNFFKIPTGAAPPIVQATELNREVVLSWGDPTNAEKTESYNSNGYRFQGYNVYQLPSASAGKDESKLIATFDLTDSISTIYDYIFDARTGKPELTPVQFGTNSGIKRSFLVNKDYLNGNVPLNNGSRYYYAVTSYSFSPDSGVIPNVLENPLSSITVTPHAPNPGVRYPVITGDTLKTVVHQAGASDASVTPLIVDPSKLTGHTYKITFQVFKVPDPATGGIRDSVVWAVFDSTANKYVEQNQNNISGNANYFIFDGIQLVVQGPPSRNERLCNTCREQEMVIFRR